MNTNTTFAASSSHENGFGMSSSAAAASSSSSAGIQATTGVVTDGTTTRTVLSPASNITQQQQQQQQQQQHHLPSLAGSVIYADVSGGTNNSNSIDHNQSIQQKQQNLIQIRIQNMSSTANLGIPLDLKKIALRCRNTEYNPKRFAAVIMRLRAEPRVTALLFASGKMVVTGVKSSHNATLAAQKIGYIVERVLGLSTASTSTSPYSVPSSISEQGITMDFKVQNIIGTANVGFPIRLEGLVYAHSAFASYEPELFPGLIYRLVHPRVVMLIFVSGKLVITGAKRESDLATALTKLYPVLVEFKKVHVSPSPESLSLSPALVQTTTTTPHASMGSKQQQQQQFPGKRPRGSSIEGVTTGVATGTATNSNTNDINTSISKSVMNSIIEL